jgi:MarR family transcriptional regulator, lower aerobic nicotinate degradation pathway regulator
MGKITDVYSAYLSQGGAPDATGFGVWLIRQQPSLEAGDGAVESPNATGVSTNAMIGILIGRMESFAHFLAKPIFKKMGLNSEDEFALLATLLYMGRVTKTSLLKQSLMEITTGSQMLKRLKEEGLILDKPNPDDGRSSFIELSARGRKFIIECFQEMEQLDLITKGLDKAEMEVLVKLLEKLDHIHSARTGLRTIKSTMERSSD